MEENSKSIRNIAIIAHVDHGKTTLVDAMFRQSGVFREGQEVAERIMDNMDLERERGITIAAKNCSVLWDDVRINIIDTPGHADFGGEVERGLSMADGVILLVDAAEGPLPQTRFVLNKALNAGLTVIVVLNKLDRHDARPDEVLNDIYDLFIDLGANDDQLEFPILYAIGKNGVASVDPDKLSNGNLKPLFDCILRQVAAPRGKSSESLQLLVTDLGYSDYLGRLAIGRIHNGILKKNSPLVLIGEDGKPKPVKAVTIKTYEGPKLEDSEEVFAGDIVVISGLQDVTIGDTICAPESPVPLKRIKVDEPTVSMEFTINNSPLNGMEGSNVQSSKIGERLFKESMRNIAIIVEKSTQKDSFIVKGRGEFQMAILIEMMRREDFELCVGRPKVIFHYENGKKMEPIESLYIECNEEYTGVVTEKLSLRKGIMTNMFNDKKGRVWIEFSIPSRALIGYRDEFLTDTRGTGIMGSFISGYEEFRGEIMSRYNGSIVSDRAGNAVPYALKSLEARGELFVRPGEPVYEGMIVGKNSKLQELNVNPTKTKKLSNVRSSGKDDSVLLKPVIPMPLEKAINYIGDDEMVEVTPKSIRLRKSILSRLTRQTLKRPKKTD